MSTAFRYTRWDPVLICSQIVTIQSTFYFAFGCIVFVFSHLTGFLPSLDQLFNPEVVSFRTTLGLLVCLNNIFAALAGSVILYYVVSRAKLCLDFTLTAYIVHLLLVYLHSGFPTSFSWWILTLSCAAVMCVCGEYFCLKSEMKAIPLLASQKASTL